MSIEICICPNFKNEKIYIVFVHSYIFYENIKHYYFRMPQIKYIMKIFISFSLNPIIIKNIQNIKRSIRLRFLLCLKKTNVHPFRHKKNKFSRVSICQGYKYNPSPLQVKIVRFKPRQQVDKLVGGFKSKKCPKTFCGASRQNMYNKNFCGASRCNMKIKLFPNCFCALRTEKKCQTNAIFWRFSLS